MNMDFGRILRVLPIVCFIGAYGVAEAPASHAAELDKIALMSGPERSERLLAGAREEGTLSLYTTLLVDQAVRPLKAGFEASHPGIEVTFVRSQAGKIVQRILAETQAGKPNADVLIGSTVEALNKADLLQPFVSPKFANYPPGLQGDGDRWFVYRRSYYGIAYNTELVPPDEAPKTWEDLLNPAWKNKMIWASGMASGGPMIIQHIREVMDPDRAARLFEGLAKQGVSQSGGSVSSLLDLVVAGEQSILISAGFHHVIKAQKSGAPVDFVPMDPQPARNDTVHLYRLAQHPHAAMLFIDYVLSKEGQQILPKAGYQVTRPGIEHGENFQKIIPELNGRTSLVHTAERMQEVAPDVMRIFKRISR